MFDWKLAHYKLQQHDRIADPNVMSSVTYIDLVQKNQTIQNSKMNSSPGLLMVENQGRRAFAYSAPQLTSSSSKTLSLAVECQNPDELQYGHRRYRLSWNQKQTDLNQQLGNTD